MTSAASNDSTRRVVYSSWTLARNPKGFVAGFALSPTTLPSTLDLLKIRKGMTSTRWAGPRGTHQSIAKALGVSQQRAHQLERSALEKLRKKLELRENRILQ